MNGIKFFPKDLQIKNKRIILRVDLNVPIHEKKILDPTRILLVIPFLQDLIKRESKIIIISHLGRPKGKQDNKLSLSPIFEYLKKKIKSKIFFHEGNIDEEAKTKSLNLKTGEILLLENIRFFKQETENDENFSKLLAQLGDIYINDAFSCSHREQSSIHKITSFVKNSYGGPLLKKEINAIDLIIKQKKSPVTCIIGGSKISTKINVILNLLKNVNNIVIVGAMANNFLTYKNHKVGKSLIEEGSSEIIKKIYLESVKSNCKIIIPEDCSVSESFQGQSIIKNRDEINSEEIILDIGPKTIDLIKKTINNSNTLLWNGPAGYIENENFTKGTYEIAKKISENTLNSSLISVLGGGDTIAAINQSNLKLSFTHLSTAGGAFLEYLEGKDLPGLSVLK
tara:strand:- start:470 stop:1660 length:1191 start_codon:yes stop_codon:yes gene_type:complete